MHEPVKTRWNSVFDCINRALQLKDAITRFSEHDMELDGWIDGEDDENTSDGEAGRVIEEMVRTTHPHSLLFLYIHISSSSSSSSSLQECIRQLNVMTLINVSTCKCSIKGRVQPHHSCSQGQMPYIPSPKKTQETPQG